MMKKEEKKAEPTLGEMVAVRELLKPETKSANPLEIVDILIAIQNTLAGVVEGQRAQAHEVAKLKEIIANKEKETAQVQERRRKVIEDTRARAEKVPPQVRARAQAKAAADITEAAKRIHDYEQARRLSRQLQEGPTMTVVPDIDEAFFFMGYPVVLKQGEPTELPVMIAKHVANRQRGRLEFKARHRVMTTDEGQMLEMGEFQRRLRAIDEEYSAVPDTRT